MDSPSKKILVVEDDEDTLGFLCESLRKKGYVVHGEATGEKGLDVFERDGRARRPELKQAAQR